MTEDSFGSQYTASGTGVTHGLPGYTQGFSSIFIVGEGKGD